MPNRPFTRSPFARPGTNTDPELATRMGTGEQALSIIEQLRNIAADITNIVPVFAVFNPGPLTGTDGANTSFELPAGRWVLNQASFSIDGFTGTTPANSRLQIGNGANVWWHSTPCTPTSLLNVNLSEFAKAAVYLVTPEIAFTSLSDYCPLVFDSATPVTLRIDHTGGGSEPVTISNMRFVFRRIGDSVGV